MDTGDWSERASLGKLPDHARLSYPPAGTSMETQKSRTLEALEKHRWHVPARAYIFVFCCKRGF